eukprot:GHRR01034697.1.p1 GENE.GHRR01034697.1~~GHRR01034697.1.p1  ORF type:complete len:105 (+),score=22.55 GHRR01034697.1:463-777(+)
MQAMRLLVWQSVCTWLFACSLALPAGVIPLIGLLLGCLTCLSYGQFSLPLAVSSSAVAPTSTAAAMPGEADRRRVAEWEYWTAAALYGMCYGVQQDGPIRLACM